MLSILLGSLLSTPKVAPDVTIEPVNKEIVRVVVPGYSFEIPKEWSIGRETPWGQRDMSLEGSKGKLGVMTGGGEPSNWDDLYRVSLYFINREERGEPTPYREFESKGGYPSIAFEVKNSEGFASRRYAILKNKDHRILALSVRIPAEKDEKAFTAHFQRMIDTARFR